MALAPGGSSLNTLSSRQSGAVNIMFLIITLMLALAGWGLWFGEKSKNEELAQAAQSAEFAEKQAATQIYQLKKGFEVFADAVGGVPTEIPATLPEEKQSEYETLIVTKFVEPIQKKARAAIKFFNGDKSQNKLIQATIPGEALVTKLESEIAQLKTQLKTAKADKSSAEKANDDMVSAHNQALSVKNDALTQTRQKNATKEQQLESQKDALSNELRTATDDLETAKTAHTAEIIATREKAASLDRSVREFKLTERVHREKKRPDGQVTDVNYRNGTCYINIGTKQGLRRGTRFETYGFAKGRVKVSHGYIVVRDTERDRALCAIENGGHPGRMDYIHSPAFDSEKKRTFHFLGNLPGRFDNQTATKILAQYGMKVETGDKIDLMADFLVLGANPEMPEEGEEPDPNWFKKTQAYSDALRWGIEMIRAEDLEMFLKY